MTRLLTFGTTHLRGQRGGGRGRGPAGQHSAKAVDAGGEPRHEARRGSTPARAAPLGARDGGVAQQHLDGEHAPAAAHAAGDAHLSVSPRRSASARAALAAPAARASDAAHSACGTAAAARRRGACRAPKSTGVSEASLCGAPPGASTHQLAAALDERHYLKHLQQQALRQARPVRVWLRHPLPQTCDGTEREEPERGVAPRAGAPARQAAQALLVRAAAAAAAAAAPGGDGSLVVQSVASTHAPARSRLVCARTSAYGSASSALPAARLGRWPTTPSSLMLYTLATRQQRVPARCTAGDQNALGEGRRTGAPQAPLAEKSGGEGGPATRRSTIPRAHTAQPALPHLTRVASRSVTPRVKRQHVCVGVAA